MSRISEGIEAITQAILEAIAGGEEVKFRGFGRFYLKRTASRRVRDLKNGGTMIIPETIRIAFEPSTQMKNAALKASDKITKKEQSK